MSIGEIFVVMVVALLVIKPQDLPTIFKVFKQVRRYIRGITADIMSKFEDHEEDVEEINRYLEKISGLDEKYEGPYELDEIKKYYHKILKKHKK